MELAVPEFLSSRVQQLYRHKLPKVNILELEFILIPVLADPKKTKTLILKDTCTPIFKAALFTIAKVWE